MGFQLKQQVERAVAVVCASFWWVAGWGLASGLDGCQGVLPRCFVERHLTWAHLVPVAGFADMGWPAFVAIGVDWRLLSFVVCAILVLTLQHSLPSNPVWEMLWSAAAPAAAVELYAC